MKPAKVFAAISLFLLLAAPGLHAACTNATAAGTFGFTTTGTLILPTGPAPDNGSEGFAAQQGGPNGAQRKDGTSIPWPSNPIRCDGVHAFVDILEPHRSIAECHSEPNPHP